MTCGITIFDFANKLIDFAGSIDERLENLALQLTDPDPNSLSITNEEARERAARFRSVVDLVPSPSVLAPRLHGENPWVHMAEQFAKNIKTLSKAQLFSRLRALEAKAFHYDPDTQTVSIVDTGSYFEIKNILLAVERETHHNRYYGEKVEDPLLYRLAIWTSDALLPKDRDFLFRLEAENGDYARLAEYAGQKEMAFLKTYDGSRTAFEYRSVQSVNLLFDYARHRWSPEVIRKGSQKYYKKTEPEYTRILMTELSLLAVASLDSLTEPELWERLEEIEIKNAQVQVASERRRIYFEKLAVMREFALRGLGERETLKRYARLWLSSYKALEDLLSPEFFEKLEPKIAAGIAATATENRIDDYRARRDYLDTLIVALDGEWRRKEASIHGSVALNIYHEFLSFYVRFGKQRGHYFTARQVAAFSEEILAYSDYMVGNGIVTEEPVNWEYLFYTDKQLTFPFGHYPKTDDPMENEWDLAKDIYYNGRRFYDLAAATVTVVTLSPPLPSTGNRSGENTTVGASHLFLGHIQIAYREENEEQITFLPVWKRLQRAAHAVFTSLSTLREYSGVENGGERIPILRQRGAHFFAAHILREYLKLRMKGNRDGRKTLMKEEMFAIAGAILENKLTGWSINYTLKDFYPTLNEEYKVPELPLELERDVAQALLPILQTNPEEISFDSNRRVKYYQAILYSIGHDVLKAEYAKATGMARTQLEYKLKLLESDETSKEKREVIREVLEVGRHRLIVMGVGKVMVELAMESKRKESN